MAQITRNMCELIIKGFEDKQGFPLTNWEAAQLAHAWLEREDASDATAAPAPAQDVRAVMLQDDEITVNLVRLAGLDKHKARECECIVRQLLERAALSAQPAPAEPSDAQIQALWNEACQDSPAKPGWSRHIRFARAVLALGVRAGDLTAPEYLAKVAADPKRAAALQRARERNAGVALDGGKHGV